MVCEFHDLLKFVLFKFLILMSPGESYIATLTTNTYISLLCSYLKSALLLLGLRNQLKQ